MCGCKVCDGLDSLAHSVQSCLIYPSPSPSAARCARQCDEPSLLLLSILVCTLVCTLVLIASLRWEEEDEDEEEEEEDEFVSEKGVSL